jgi:hypothetical protein
MPFLIVTSLLLIAEIPFPPFESQLKDRSGSFRAYRAVLTTSVGHVPADVIETWIQHPNQRFMTAPQVGYLAG